MDEQICLVEELHIAMQRDDVRLMGGKINEFQLVSAGKAKHAGDELHPHRCPAVTRTSCSAEDPLSPKMLR